MKVVRKGNVSLYEFKVGNSTYLVNPFVGARLLSWNIESNGQVRSVIPWNSDATEGKVNGGNPILFPFPSSSFVGKTPHIWRTPRGDVRPMQRHGYAWSGKFEVAYSSDTELKLKFIPCADFNSCISSSRIFFLSIFFLKSLR